MFGILQTHKSPAKSKAGNCWNVQGLAAPYGAHGNATEIIAPISRPLRGAGCGDEKDLNDPTSPCMIGNAPDHRGFQLKLRPHRTPGMVPTNFELSMPTVQTAARPDARMRADRNDAFIRCAADASCSIPLSSSVQAAWARTSPQAGCSAALRPDGDRAAFRDRGRGSGRRASRKISTACGASNKGLRVVKDWGEPLTLAVIIGNRTQTGFQGEGGACRHQGRDDAGPAC
jgi:hypothetical protein